MKFSEKYHFFEFAIFLCVELIIVLEKNFKKRDFK